MHPEPSPSASHRAPAVHRQTGQWRVWAFGVTGLCLLGFMALAAKVHRLPYPLHVDMLALWLVSVRPFGFAVVPVHAARIFQQLGTATAFAFLVGSLVLGAALVRDRVGVLLALVGPPVAVVLTEAVGKPGVARPEGYMAANAFPSGHVTAMAAIAATVALLAYRRWGPRGLASVAPVAALLPLVMTVVVTRLHSHDFTDGLGGIAVGVGTIAAVAVLLSAAFERRSSTQFR